MIRLYADGHSKGNVTSVGYIGADSDCPMFTGGAFFRENKNVVEAEFLSILVALYDFTKNGREGPVIVINDNQTVIGQLLRDRPSRNCRLVYCDYCAAIKDYTRKAKISDYLLECKDHPMARVAHNMANSTEMLNCPELDYTDKIEEMMKRP
jgi:hypothetical protein